MELPDERLTLVAALLARYLEDGNVPTISDLEKVADDLDVPRRPLLHLLGYLPLARMAPRTGYRLHALGADERVWLNGWDRESAGKATYLDVSDEVSANCWRVCRALHDFPPLFEVYSG